MASVQHNDLTLSSGDKGELESRMEEGNLSAESTSCWVLMTLCVHYLQGGERQSICVLLYDMDAAYLYPGVEWLSKEQV